MSGTPGADAGRRKLTWHLEGPAVQDGTVPVDYVVRVLENLQAAVRHITESVLDESKGRRRGPPSREIAEQTTLRLVEIGKGSFQATVELPRPTQERMWDAGEEALEKLLSALETLSKHKDPSSIPASALPEIRSLTEIVGDGITSVTYKGGAPRHQHLARFDAPVVLPEPLTAPVPRQGTVSGRLREVDFKDHTAELYDASGRMTRVAFAPEQEDDLKSAANLHVTIEGELEDDPTSKRRTVKVGSVTAERQGIEFWVPVNLDRLAAAQGISPLSAKRLRPAAFWPSDLDPEDFLTPIREDRNGGE